MNRRIRSVERSRRARWVVGTEGIGARFVDADHTCLRVNLCERARLLEERGCLPRIVVRRVRREVGSVVAEVRRKRSLIPPRITGRPVSLSGMSSSPRVRLPIMEQVADRRQRSMSSGVGRPTLGMLVTGRAVSCMPVLRTGEETIGDSS